MSIDPVSLKKNYLAGSNPFSLATFWLVMSAAGMVAFFWDGLISLGVAWTRPEYSYGPLVPLITAYMTLRELHRHPVTPNDDSRAPGLSMVFVGLVLGLAGNLSKIPDVSTYGFIVVIGGLVLILTGWRQGLRFWPGWLHLVFMLPLPNVVYWPISTKLQFISSNLGVQFVSLLGIPVYLDGNIIDLGLYKLQVAEACSGLRYLFPLMSFGWLFAVLYNGPFWHRVVLFSSTIPITIAMNSFRIGVIGVLVNYFGIEQAQGFLHVFEGWTIFISCVLVLFCEAWLLQRLAPNPKPARDIIDIDFEGIFTPLRKLKNVAADAPLVTAASLILIAGLAWQLNPVSAAARIDRNTFDAFPVSLDGWNGSRVALEPTIERVLGADDYLLTDYVRSDGRSTVNLFISFYQSTTEGSGLHSPEVCIPAGGWEVSKWTQVSISPSSAMQPFVVNRAIIQKGVSRQLVYYWFEQRGHRLTNDYLAKLYTLWDSISRGRSDGALVRVVTPIETGESDISADAKLVDFIGSVLPILPHYVPL